MLLCFVLLHSEAHPALSGVWDATFLEVSMAFFYVRRHPDVWNSSRFKCGHVFLALLIPFSQVWYNSSASAAVASSVSHWSLRYPVSTSSCLFFICSFFLIILS